MRREYLLDVGVVVLDRAKGEEMIGGELSVGDGREMEKGRGFEDTREDGGEKLDKVGRIFGIVGGVTDIDDDVDVDVLSQTSKLTCVR